MRIAGIGVYGYEHLTPRAGQKNVVITIHRLELGSSSGRPKHVASGFSVIGPASEYQSVCHHADLVCDGLNCGALQTPPYRKTLHIAKRGFFETLASLPGAAPHQDSPHGQHTRIAAAGPTLPRSECGARGLHLFQAATVSTASPPAAANNQLSGKPTAALPTLQRQAAAADEDTKSSGREPRKHQQVQPLTGEGVTIEAIPTAPASPPRRGATGRQRAALLLRTKRVSWKEIAAALETNGDEARQMAQAAAAWELRERQRSILLATITRQR